MNIKIHLKQNNTTNSLQIIVSRRKNNRFSQIEKLGLYDKQNNHILMNIQRTKYWLQAGAKITNRIYILLEKMKQLSNEKTNSSI